MRRIVLFLVFILFCLVNAVSAVNSYMIPISSSFYSDIDYLYSLLGEVPPSASRPYSYAEASAAMDRIRSDVSSMEGSVLELYKSIEEELASMRPRWSVPDESFSYGADVSVQPEMYVHTNGEKFRGDKDWVYNYNERKPFLHLGLEASVYDVFYTYADLEYTLGRYSADGAEYLDISELPGGIGALEITSGADNSLVIGSKQYYSTFSTNIAFKSAEFNFEWPRRALVSFGGSFWNFLIGRDQINWGSSHVGNFVLDSHVPYHDMMRLVFFTEYFKYEWTNVFLETKFPMQESSAEDSFKMLMAHRLEFRPLSWLDFAISENVMYKAPGLNLKYLNPGFIFHNLNDASMFNAIAHAELTVLPIKGLEIYFQAVLDQARAPNENDSQSDAWGILGGIDYTFPISKGIISLNLEVDYTTPLLYRRDEVDFIIFQKDFTYNNGSLPSAFYYIGFPYGGDVIALYSEINYRLPPSLDLSLSIEGLLKGEMNMLKSHNKDGDIHGASNYSGTTPSGNDLMRVFILTLSGKYDFPQLWSFLDFSLWGNISFVMTDIYDKSTGTSHDGRSDLQTAIGFGIYF